ncbi:MAG: galactose oxidase-like domain-containing protein, partial [Planctomycetota bacterium]
PLFHNALLALPRGGGDFFCAGHAWTSDGRLLVAGGTEEYPDRDDHDHDFITGGRLLYLYDPGFGDLGRWTRQLDLAADRWYPTVLATGSGELLVAGGLDSAARPAHTSYEVFPGDRAGSPGRGQHTARTLFSGPGGPASEFELYPRMHLLRSGDLFVVGFDGASARGNHALAPGAWTVMDAPELAARDEYCSLVLPVPFGGPEVVLVIGGAVPDLAGVRRPVRKVEACQPGAPGAPGWDWQLYPPLNIARSHHNALILPTRALLVLGGRTSASDEPEQGTLVPELFDGRRWRVLAPAASARAYHSTALLLPDASVLTAGGDHRAHDYQVFHPPYPFPAHPRPVLTGVPPVLPYSGVSPAWHTLTFTLAPGEAFGHAALVAPGSVTHSLDFSQRYVELESSGAGATSVQVRGPLDSNHAPPGHYMLFLVSAAGSPSLAAWVELR